MKNRNRKKGLVIFFGLLSFLVILVSFYKNNLIINEITCRSQYWECNQAIFSELENAKGKPVLTSRKLLTEILESTFLVKDFSLQLSLPLSYKVDILERKPKFALRKDKESVFSHVTPEGLILSRQDSSNLPYIIINEELPGVGEKVKDELLFSLVLVGEVEERFGIKEARFLNESLVIDLQSGEAVIFPVRGDKRNLLGALFLIMSELSSSNESRIGVEKVYEIDLRFKNPILKKTFN